jgi:glycosyltransferase involved in cell wall biosynthesis
VKIVHLNTHDVTGGAARAMYRLHLGLQRAGQNSSVFARDCISGDRDVREFRPGKGLIDRAKRRLRARQIRHEAGPYLGALEQGTFHNERTIFGQELWNQIPPYDIINLHWVAGFVDYRAFFDHLPRSTPIVWTLHDMNPFTGGCHYANTCRRFMDRCGMCPLLDSETSNDLSRRVFDRKNRLFNNLSTERLHVVTPSRWLANEVSGSALMSRFDVTVIPNGVDTDVFAPTSTPEIRSKLGLDPTAKIILFASQSKDDPRKGFALLLAALAKLGQPQEYLLLCLGDGSGTVEGPVRMVDAGRLADDRELAEIYSISDVHVVPSLEDNLPNTVLEAMACGTPTVGNRVGGIPEIVRPERTGLVVSCTDPARFARALEETCRQSNAYSETCRHTAVSKYSLSVQADEYIRLYSDLLRIPPR